MDRDELELYLNNVLQTASFKDYCPNGLQVQGRRRIARIATGVTQAALARLLFEMDPNACVASPRIHVQGVDLLVDREIATDVRDALKTRGESVKEEPWQGSAIQMVAWDRSGGKPKILAASDPRKAGLSLAR